MHTEQEKFASVLEDIAVKAGRMPVEDFLEMLDKLVEDSRKYINSFEDEETRSNLRQMYQGIVRYALDCQVRIRQMN